MLVGRSDHCPASGVGAPTEDRRAKPHTLTAGNPAWRAAMAMAGFKPGLDQPQALARRSSATARRAGRLAMTGYGLSVLRCCRSWPRHLRSGWVPFRAIAPGRAPGPDVAGSPAARA